MGSTVAGRRQDGISSSNEAAQVAHFSAKSPLENTATYTLDRSDFFPRGVAVGRYGNAIVDTFCGDSILQRRPVSSGRFRNYFGEFSVAARTSCRAMFQKHRVAF